MNEELIVDPLRQNVNNDKEWIVNVLEENVKNTIESIQMNDARYQYTKIDDNSAKNANQHCIKVLETYRKQYLDLINKCGHKIENPLYKKEHDNRDMACDFPFTKIKEQDRRITELEDRNARNQAWARDANLDNQNIRINGLENQINRKSKVIIILVSIILWSIIALLIVFFYNSNKKHIIKRLVISSLISSFFGFFMFGVYLLSGRRLRFLYPVIFVGLLIIVILWFYFIYDRQTILLSIMFLVMSIFMFILFGFLHHLLEHRLDYGVYMYLY